MQTATIIFLLQVICCSLLFVMYIPQILKIGHNHSVVGISLPYNYIKVLLTIVSCLVLELASNNLIVIMAQYVSLALGGVMLAQVVFYQWKSGEKKGTYIMIVVSTLSIVGVAILTMTIPDVLMVVYILQVISLVVLFAQYIPQVNQLHKCKTVGDVSITHWLCKLIYSAFSLGILVLSGNCILVALTQVFNFVFTLVIFLQCMKYKEGGSKGGRNKNRI